MGPGKAGKSRLPADFSPENGRVTALIDWENSHMGDPREDLGWLALMDVLTATNLNRMYALLDHPLIGPAYNELARACLPGRDLAPWTDTSSVAPAEPAAAPQGAPPADAAGDDGSKRRGLFRR